MEVLIAFQDRGEGSPNLTPPPSEQKLRCMSYDFDEILQGSPELDSSLEYDIRCAGQNKRRKLYEQEETNGPEALVEGVTKLRAIEKDDGNDKYELNFADEIDGDGENTVAEAHTPRSLATAPLEIQNMIFGILQDQSDRCTATCLSLTCRQLRAVFETFYKDRIPLTVSTCVPVEGGYEGESVWINLATLLDRHDMPEQYRLSRGPISHRNGPMFLNGEVYGEWVTCRSPKEIELVRKWQDYERNWNLRLPSPYGKGDDWYPEAVRALQKKWKGLPGKGLWDKNADSQMKDTRKWFGNSAIRAWIRTLRKSKGSKDSCRKDWKVLMDLDVEM